MATQKNETLVVLKPPRATIDVVRLARKLKWEHKQRIDPGERRFYEEVYEVPGSGTVVRIIDDHFVQIIYVAIEGSGRKDVEAAIRKEVQTLDDSAIAALVKSDNAKERATGIRILGAIAPDTADKGTVAAFKAAADDDSADVFKALTAAVGRAAWPELWPVVDKLAATGKAEGKDLAKAYEARVPR
jgi:hypothetical protein